MRKVWIIWSPLLYFNFQNFLDLNSSSFIRFQCILHDSGVLFSESWNFYKLKRGDLISGGNQFCRKSELFGPPFCISILKVWFSTPGWFRSTFLRVLKFLQIKDGGLNFWWEPILQKVWIIWSPLLYFNFKSFLDPNSLSFIRFQCILHDSGVLFSESWNIYKLKRGNHFCRKSELFGTPFRIIKIIKIC